MPVHRTEIESTFPLYGTDFEFTAELSGHFEKSDNWSHPDYWCDLEVDKVRIGADNIPIPKFLEPLFNAWIDTHPYTIVEALEDERIQSR